jgi:hypothetical protein
MKKLFTLVCALFLGATLSFAVPQDTGGSKADTGKTDKKEHKGGKKGHKGGKKGKKGDKGGDTTAPPK